MVQKNQRGFSIIELVLILFVVAIVIMAGIFAYSRFRSRTSNNSPLSKSQIESLPDISYYQTHKSDQFIVDMNLVHTGFPLKGQRAVLPHNGAHAQFGTEYQNWPKGGAAPEDYPPIYSPVDGYVTGVNPHYSDYSKNQVDLYSIEIGFAKSGDKVWHLFYSIEPFVKEPSEGFFAKFIDVQVGQQVHKDQVIGHMYLSAKSGGENREHIHFQLNEDENTHILAPAIFSKEVVQQFHDHWNNFGVDAINNDPSGTRIPVCMGYKLSADENPFGTGPVDCLL